MLFGRWRANRDRADEPGRRRLPLWRLRVQVGQLVSDDKHAGNPGRLRFRSHQRLFDVIARIPNDGVDRLRRVRSRTRSRTLGAGVVGQRSGLSGMAAPPDRALAALISRRTAWATG